jgi:hypothetical protein
VANRPSARLGPGGALGHVLLVGFRWQDAEEARRINVRC